MGSGVIASKVMLLYDYIGDIEGFWPVVSDRLMFKKKTL